MRTSALLIFVAACADGAAGGVNYDQVAQMLGTSIATPGGGGETGALADSAILARGGLPVGFQDEEGVFTGMHDGVRYTYLVVCQDSSGARTPCSPVTFRAFVVADWSTPTQTRAGMWTLEHLQGSVASVTGRSAVTHDSNDLVVNDDREEAFLLDLGSYEPRHGDIATTLGIPTANDVVIPGTIQFDDSQLALISLPQHVYQIDLATGDVVPVSILR